MNAEFFRERSQAAFRAPITLVVMPDECQSMPIPAPNDWNQNGCDSRFVAAVVVDYRLRDDGAPSNDMRRLS